MSSLCPSFLFPNSPPCFFRTTSLSVAIWGPSEGDSGQGCRRHAKRMAEPLNPSLSLYLLCDWLCSCYSVQLVA